jgi:hypothetical protein
MTTNLHDKMLAAIDAYFSASDGTEAEVAENLLLDVRDEINKQKYVPETNFGDMAEPKIGCVNHDCDKCKAVQEPEYWNVVDPAGNIVASETDAIRGWARIAGSYKPTVEGLLGFHDQGWRVLPKVTPPAPQPVPVKTYHDGKPWPVAPKPWVGLTHEEVNSWELPDRPTVFEFAKFIEAKLKEKNT